MDGSLDKDARADIDPVTDLRIGREVDSNPARWPDKRLIAGRLVRLELLNPALHSDDLWKVAGGIHNAELWLYMSDGPFAERWEFNTLIRNAVEQEDPVFYAIVNQLSGRVVGWCGLLNIRPKHRAIEVGYLLFSAELQRTAAATEAIYLLSGYVFEELGYRRYEWKCNALNAKSRRAAERFGFKFEGIFRQHMIIKGRNRDSAWFSMTSEEWPGLKRAFETWLAPANFDEHGQQRQKLHDLMNANAPRDTSDT